MTSPFDAADLARVTRDLVAIPSVSGDERAAARHFVEVLAGRGFRSCIDDAGNAVGTIGEGPVTIALVGHIDTVPGHIDVRIEDGVLHGRGAVDAKGPLATLAAAAARATEASAAGGHSGARFIVVGCVEEEAPSSAGARHLMDRPAPDALVIGEPSHWDGVTLGYKGYLRAEATLERESAHGAHEAESAPEAACALWSSVAAAARAFVPQDAPLFDQLMPRLTSVSSGHDGTMDSARLQLSLRLPPELTPAEATRWLEAHCEGARAQLRVFGEAPAWRGPRTSAIARSLGRAILGAGGQPRYQVKTGTADLNLLAPAWGCPSVAYGPGDAALDHTPHERVEVAELDRAASVLANALIHVTGTLSTAKAAPIPSSGAL